ncbi:5-oxoprolinase subunit C family protein [Vibrio algarum]|uniref:Biotin-dependent carboxyltransferase family protein n=1 Tax=Vibrio algarum TaxID=3020714 RepID=A0ABT4YXH4_9VIBR|nr:biotin-dependent carboxyltransferase family protein [Vibrio sp. KJ40-1]MDB1126294.1 biotin-dependent carboxyltransferase family protein [Vibrio sp. KJ40-1]
MGYLKVIKPGQLSLIQDFGRYGIAPLGVTQGGPLDEYAYCWANHLLGNRPNCSTIEITLGQAEFQFTQNCMLAICGGDLQAKLDDTPIRNWTSFYVRRGQVLKFGLPINGLRAYLAVEGGFDIETHLGSTSTVIREQLGGLNQDGTALIQNDKIKYTKSSTKLKSKQLTFRFTPDYNLPLRLRLIESYQSNQFSKQAKRAFYNQTYKVSPNSDRMGYRLEGVPIIPPVTGVISEGIALGSVQIPPDGKPIILLNDRQTLGGYPKLGVLARIDHARIAQAKPGQEVKFIRGNRRHLQDIWCAWALRFGY